MKIPIFIFLVYGKVVGSTFGSSLLVLAIIIWKEMGFGIVLFFARLMSVSEEIYDAAKIDGANWWQTLWPTPHPLHALSQKLINFTFSLTRNARIWDGNVPKGSGNATQGLTLSPPKANGCFRWPFCGPRSSITGPTNMWVLARSAG